MQSSTVAAVLAAFVAIPTLSGCSGDRTTVSSSDGAENRKVKEDVGRQVLQPIEPTKGRPGARKGSVPDTGL